MASTNKPTLLVLGGAGAQNSVIINSFSSLSTYNIRVLTRSKNSPHAQEVSVLPNVTLIEGDCYDEETLNSVFKDVDYCYVNTNGFAIGEKNEIFWGIRMYEIARWAGVKHFVYSGLPYVTRNGGFDPKRRVPFVDGKAKVAQFLSAQPTKDMAWSVLESGPYVERLWDMTPRTRKDENGVYVFKLPLGSTGAMPLVSLEDMGKYAQWIFANPDRSAGLILGVAIGHITGAEHASAFEAVTGHKARYEAVSIDDAVAHLPPDKIGAKASPGFDDPTLKNAAEHFAPWWGIFVDSGGNTGCWTRDYELLDEILPERIRTLEEWMRSVGYDGSLKPLLKTGLSIG